jgi:hypothetical protein
VLSDVNLVYRFVRWRKIRCVPSKVLSSARLISPRPPACTGTPALALSAYAPLGGLAQLARCLPTFLRPSLACECLRSASVFFDVPDGVPNQVLRHSIIGHRLQTVRRPASCWSNARPVACRDNLCRARGVSSCGSKSQRITPSCGRIVRKFFRPLLWICTVSNLCENRLSSGTFPNVTCESFRVYTWFSINCRKAAKNKGLGSC